MQGPSQAEVNAKEELQSKAKPDKPKAGLFRYLATEAKKPAPIGHPVLRTLPATK
jgi:hypothetical protein